MPTSVTALAASPNTTSDTVIGASSASEPSAKVMPTPRCPSMKYCKTMSTAKPTPLSAPTQ